MKKFILSGLIMLCFLSFAYTQQYVNCYTYNSNLCTGSVSQVLFSYPVTDDELIVGNPFHSHAWAKFNISGVPDNAIINNIEIYLYVYQASSTPSSHELIFSSLYVDPVTASGNTLYKSIDDSPDYLEKMDFGDATGLKLFKGNPTIMINDINSSLIKNWFAVGFYERNGDAGACYIAGHLSANAPYLVINFSLPAPTNVVATDGTYCDKVRISWNAVTNADRYYIYRGTTGIGYTSNLYFDYFGASTSPEEYSVYAAKSTIDNRFSSKYGSNSGYKKSKPNQPGQITGSTQVCQGSSQTYSISPVSGATSYTWTLPSGWSGSSTSTSISATVGDSDGTITVTANNSCGSSVPTTKGTWVEVPNQISAMTGPTSVCQGTTYTYNLSSVIAGSTTAYSLTCPSGWYTVSGGVSGSKASFVLTAGSSGTITFVAQNSCGSVTRTLDVTASTTPPAQPGGISGSDLLCGGGGPYSLIYSIRPVSGATSYTWILPSGWSGNPAETSILINGVENSGTLSVTANNSCGQSTPRTMNIVIASKPTITTSSVSTLSSTSATGGGNITFDGGAEVTASGVCWDTSPDPTTSDSKTTDGLTIGSFESTITGLTENETYYIRAYATNCSGTSYGSNVEYNSSNAVEDIQSFEISVYPNPVSGILNIEYRNGTYETINIINQQGVLLLTERIVSSQQQLDFSKYEYGLYILEFVKHGGGIKRVKVVHK